MRNYDNVAQYGWDGLASELAQSAAGDVYYVDANASGAANNATSGQGDSWATPFSTVNYAVSRCANDGGNVVFVAADHTETITSTATASGDTANQFVIDKSGVTIIGLGTSDRRPTFSFSGAVTAEVYIVATEVTLKNLLFVSAIIDLETLIEAVAGSSGLILENCEFRDGGASLEAMDEVSLAADVDDIVIRGCRFITSDTGSSTQSAIMMAGGCDRGVIQDNYFYGDWGGGGYAVIEGGTAASIGILIDSNVIYNLDATKGEAITMHSGTTGFITNNVVYTTNAASSPIQSTLCVKANNKVTSVLLAEAQPQGSSGAIANGNHFYVDSGTGVDTATGLSWHDPLATVDAAIGKCTDAYGDIVHVAKGHAENVATATVVTCDKTHMSIIGEGTGEERPLITFITNAEAMYTVTADSVRIENMRFGCNITNQNHMINVDGDDCQIINCEFIENGQVPLTAITADTTGGDGHGSNLLVKGCRIYGPTNTNWDAGIEIAQDFEGIVIEDNYIMGDFDAACIEFAAAANATQDIVIRNNICINEQAGLYCIHIEDTALAVTGICANNILVSSARATALMPNILNCYGNVWMNITAKVAPVLLEGDITTPGQNIYVNSAHTQAVDDVAHGHSWDHPLALIEYANTNRMTANNNDIIHVGPGHNENISDSVFCDFDTAGVTVIGYGVGDDRPSISFDHASAVVDVGAANICLKNLRFLPSITAIVVGVDVLDTFDGCQIIDCQFGPAVAGGDEFSIALQLGDNCDRTLVKNCKFMAGGEAATDAIFFNKDNDHVEVTGCTFTGAYSNSVILGGTTACTELDIHDNVFMHSGGTPIFALVAASTGMVRDNRCVIGTATFAADFDIGNCWCVNNFCIADDDVGGGKVDNRFTASGTQTETADG